MSIFFVEYECVHVLPYSMLIRDDIPFSTFLLSQKLYSEFPDIVLRQIFYLYIEKINAAIAAKTDFLFIKFIVKTFLIAHLLLSAKKGCP